MPSLPFLNGSYVLRRLFFATVVSCTGVEVLHAAVNPDFVVRGTSVEYYGGEADGKQGLVLSWLHQEGVKRYILKSPREVSISTPPNKRVHKPHIIGRAVEEVTTNTISASGFEASLIGKEWRDDFGGRWKSWRDRENRARISVEEYGVLPNYIYEYVVVGIKEDSTEVECPLVAIPSAHSDTEYVPDEGWPIAVSKNPLYVPQNTTHENPLYKARALVVISWGHDCHFEGEYAVYRRQDGVDNDWILLTNPESTEIPGSGDHGSYCGTTSHFLTADETSYIDCSADVTKDYQYKIVAMKTVPRGVVSSTSAIKDTKSDPYVWKAKFTVNQFTISPLSKIVIDKKSNELKSLKLQGGLTIGNIGSMPSRIGKLKLILVNTGAQGYNPDDPMSGKIFELDSPLIDKEIASGESVSTEVGYLPGKIGRDGREGLGKPEKGVNFNKGINADKVKAFVYFYGTDNSVTYEELIGTGPCKPPYLCDFVWQGVGSSGGIQ